MFYSCFARKNGNIYLRIKKRGRIIDENKLNDFKMTVYSCVKTYYIFYCNSDCLLKEKYFIELRLIKTNSGHHFHFICLRKDKYVNRFWERVPTR